MNSSGTPAVLVGTPSIAPVLGPDSTPMRTGGPGTGSPTTGFVLVSTTTSPSNLGMSSGSPTLRASVQIELLAAVYMMGAFVRFLLPHA
jgi:hypothetical protein